MPLLSPPTILMKVASPALHSPPVGLRPTVTAKARGGKSDKRAPGNSCSSNSSSSSTSRGRRGKSPSKARWNQLLLRTLRQNASDDKKKDNIKSNHRFFHQGDYPDDATASMSMSLQSPSEAGFASVAFRSSPLCLPPIAPVMEMDLEDSESSEISLVAEPIVPEEEMFDYHITRNAHTELGFVSTRCQGSLHQALALARQTHKPILCLQMDVPGDGRIGAEVFSHPLIVEAAETLFVTVHVRDGIQHLPHAEEGRDLSDPSPSHQTSLDFLSETGARLIPRLYAPGIHRASVVQAMVEALKLFQQTVPKYLQLLRDEENGQIEVAAFGVRYRENCSVFGMDDSAHGEVEFAGLGGVLATKAGYIDRLRVVQVSYDSKLLSFGCLVRHALERQIANIVYYQSNDERIAAQVEIERLHDTAQTKLFSGPIKPDLDPKAALRKTPLRFVPLTAYQSTRANRFVQLGRFDEAVHLLSPRQGLILMKTMHVSAQKSLHIVVDVPLLPAWLSVCEEQSPKRFMDTKQPECPDDPCSDELEQGPSSSIYEYNSYSLSTACLPPGYPWHDF